MTVHVDRFRKLGSATGIGQYTCTNCSVVLSFKLAVDLLMTYFVSRVYALFASDARVRDVIVKLALPFILCRFKSKLRMGFKGWLQNVTSMHPLVHCTFLYCVMISLPYDCLFNFALRNNPFKV